MKSRHGKRGDYFFPEGMRGKKKKLKKIFSDQKISRDRKNEVPIICVGGEIAGVLGYRTDARFVVENDETEFIKVAWISSSSF